MPRYTAVVATTAKLADGFQHSKSDLIDMADQIAELTRTDPFISDQHHPARPPLARILSVRCGSLAVDESRIGPQYAVFVDFEPLAGTEKSYIDTLLLTGGFSPAFFGDGLGQGPDLPPECVVRIGASPALLEGDRAIEAALEGLAARLPRDAVEVRQYHQHTVAPSDVIVVVLTWIGLKVADKLFDRIWSVVTSKTIAAWRQSASAMHLTLRSGTVDVHMELPVVGAPEEYRKAITIGIDEIAAPSSGMIKRRVSIVVLENWAIERHEETVGLGPNAIEHDDDDVIGS